MKIRFCAFNIILLSLTASMLGCQSSGRKKKEFSTFRIHIETNQDGSGNNGPIRIGRSEPFIVNIEKAPFITEYHVEQASVIDGLGGFQIMVQFNQQGTWLLEQYSLASRDKRAAIFSNFDQARWLAAPKLTRRMSDGVLVFTPDATREEADRLARGLNNLVKEIKKGNR